MTTRPNTALSPARMNVLRLMCAGATRQEAADRLTLSVNTIITHCNTIHKHYRVSTTMECVVLAMMREDVILSPWELYEGARPDLLTDRQMGVLYALATGAETAALGEAVGFSRYTANRELVVLRSFFRTKRSRVVVTRAIRSGIISRAKLEELYADRG